MDHWQKARELADTIERIIDRKYKRFARTIAERLDEEFSPLSLSAAGPPATRWKEFKTQLRQKASYACDLSEQFIKKCCSELLRELPADERSVLWLSDTADKGKRDVLALELHERVQDLAVLHCGARPSFDSEMADAGMNSEFTAAFPRRVFGSADQRATGPTADRA